MGINLRLLPELPRALISHFSRNRGSRCVVLWFVVCLRKQSLVHLYCAWLAIPRAASFLKFSKTLNSSLVKTQCRTLVVSFCISSPKRSLKIIPSGKKGQTVRRYRGQLVTLGIAVLIFVISYFLISFSWSSHCSDTLYIPDICGPPIPQSMQVVNGKRLGWYAEVEGWKSRRRFSKTGSLCAETTVKAKTRKLAEGGSRFSWY